MKKILYDTYYSIVNFKITNRNVRIVIEYILFFYFRIFVFKRIKRKKRVSPRFFFGLTPIINNKYWSNALRQRGYESDTFSEQIPGINKNSDFDFILNELFPVKNIKNANQLCIQRLKLFAYLLEHYDILVMSFAFNIFSGYSFWRYEGLLLKKSGLKIIIIPYGSDYYMYSKVIDLSLRHNLILNVPDASFQEELIQDRANYWKKYADFLIMGLMVDGAARWDCLPVNVLCIDVMEWVPKTNFTLNNGKNGVVKIVHTPNHRGFKGTEFVEKVVKELQAEGYNIELLLIEKKQNEEVKNILQTEADILIEQLIFSGYALSGIEGLSVGLPVISNLERDDILQIFKRYSYLNECPVVSSSPETIKDNLRKLIENPELRKQLGICGREYVLKYHSFNTFGSLIDMVVRKIWHQEKIDLMGYFNPQNENSYNNQSALIKPPLVNNRIPV